jgi:cation/acetate symporter
MTTQNLTYLFVGLTFAMYIVIAIRSRAGSTKDFYVAGGACPRLPTVWPPLPTGCPPRRSSPWRAHRLRWLRQLVYLMGWTGGYVLLALLLAPYLRKFGKFTVPEFVGDRYYSTAARVVAVICAHLRSRSPT